jgi:hypothetical protein
MQNFSPSPVEIVSSFWRNYTLIKVMATRQITGRYRGSFIGILWAFFNPLFTLAVYTFVFSVILGSRWNLESDSKTEFALVLFCGLIVFNLFAECINNAPNSILSNVNYVKKVVFSFRDFAVGDTCFGCFSRDGQLVGMVDGLFYFLWNASRNRFILAVSNAAADAFRDRILVVARLLRSLSKRCITVRWNRGECYDVYVTDFLSGYGYTRTISMVFVSQSADDHYRTGSRGNVLG